MNIDKKFWAAVLILLVWGCLVVSGFTPVTDYITTLRDILVGLGVYHATLTPPQQ